MIKKVPILTITGPLLDGFEAAHEGISQIFNPYPHKTPSYYDWTDGHWIYENCGFAETNDPVLAFHESIKAGKIPRTGGLLPLKEDLLQQQTISSID